jgi:hypothetical protein
MLPSNQAVHADSMCLSVSWLALPVAAIVLSVRRNLQVKRTFGNTARAPVRTDVVVQVRSCDGSLVIVADSDMEHVYVWFVAAYAQLWLMQRKAMGEDDHKRADLV